MATSTDATSTDATSTDATRPLRGTPSQAWQPGDEVPRWVPGSGGAAVGLLAGLAIAVVQSPSGSTGPGVSTGAAAAAGAAVPGVAALLALAALAGATVGLVVGHRPRGHAAAVAVGLQLGLLWWVVVGLTLLPLLDGRPVTWSAAAAEAAFGLLAGGLLLGGLAGLGAHLGAAGYLRARGARSSTGDPAPAPAAAPTPTRSPDARRSRGHARSLPEPARRVVVVGGGFAGVAVAQRLERQLARRPDVEVVLVSASNYLLFTPMLAGVAAGALEARHISAPLRAACPDTVVHRATVEAVDTDQRLVHLRTAADAADGPVETLAYDHLVLAIGAVPSFRGLPGVAEHAWSLKSLDDAVRLRDHVLGLLERADVEPDGEERRRQLTFVVAGGGFAGAELVAELVDLVHDVRRYYPRIDPAELRFVLVHGQDRILPELDRSLADYALAQLRDKGVEPLLSARVAGATADRVELADGRVLPARTIVWTAGNRPNPLVAALPVPTVGSGAVACEPTMRVAGHTDVWALGDCAAVPDPDEPGRFQPPTAQHALREGTVVADNIAAALRGRPPRPFRFRTIGLLVALGHQQGAAQVRGLRFSGRLAWLMWRSVYLSKLPGFEKRLRVALDWTLDLLFPRDLVLTRPAAGRSR